MTRPRDLSPDTEWLDMVETFKLGLEYKRGHLARAILRFRLIEECGHREEHADEFIALCDEHSLAELEVELRTDGKPVQVEVTKKDGAYTSVKTKIH